VGVAALVQGVELEAQHTGKLIKIIGWGIQEEKT
jgi:hypothetical protein